MSDSQQLPRQIRRECAECGVPVRPGDGGIRVQGKLYCSDACADGETWVDDDPVMQAIEETGW